MLIKVWSHLDQTLWHVNQSLVTSRSYDMTCPPGGHYCDYYIGVLYVYPSRYPVRLSSLCNSCQKRVPVDEVQLLYMTGYQDNSSNNGCRSTCLIEFCYLFDNVITATDNETLIPDVRSDTINASDLRGITISENGNTLRIWLGACQFMIFLALETIITELCHRGSN